MSEHPAQILQPLTARNSRKELLILSCAVDRAVWRKTCQAATQKTVARTARDVLGYLDLASSVLPGFFGRWLRRANFVAQLGRMMGWLRL